MHSPHQIGLNCLSWEGVLLLFRGLKEPFQILFLKRLPLASFKNYAQKQFNYLVLNQRPQKQTPVINKNTMHQVKINARYK